MSIPTEIFKRLLKVTDPTITLHNIQDVAHTQAQTNVALAKLVHHKCHRFMTILDFGKSVQEMSIPSIHLIIESLENLYDENPTPAGSFYEEELVQVLKEADNELLTKWWNEYSAYGGWSFTDKGTDDPNMHPILKHKHGWFVRGEERITVSHAIEDMLESCMDYIEYWIHRYTKTIYLNTTTEEWTMTLHIDPTDHKAVEEMYLQLRLVLMGDELGTPS